MTVKYFVFPFGVDGTLATIPDPTQLSGVMSYQEGFGVDYQLIDTDPASLNIPRDQFNQLMFDVTGAIQQLQQNGFPVHVTSAMNDGSPFPYTVNSFVRATDNNVYYSLINGNTDVPPSANWQLFINGGNVPSSISTGMMVDFWGVTLPSGFVWANGQTIGNASSNATGFADASTSALFATLWAAPSANFPMFTSAGSPQTRGANAAADYAANYAITLPDCRERSTAGVGTMGGTADPARITTGGSGISGATLGAAGGLETVALTSAQNAAHTHDGSGMVTNSAGLHNHTVNGLLFGGAPGSTQAILTSGFNSPSPVTTDLEGLHTHTITGSTGSSGSGTAHQNTQPTIMCNKIIKL